MGIVPQVHLLGLRDDVPDILAESNLFALASRAEGLTLSVIEAMGAALPVVVTDVGGHRELLNSAMGELIPPGDSLLFRQAIARILRDPNRARDLGAAGRSHVSTKFSLERQVESQLDFIRESYIRAVSSRRLRRSGT
jgi:glycosyltransferase involved in cell wall biosynthesis